MGQVVVFMDRPVEFEFVRGNLFRVFNPNTGMVHIVEAGVLAETIARAAAAYRDYRTHESAEVIAFPRPGHG